MTDKLLGARDNQPTAWWYGPLRWLSATGISIVQLVLGLFIVYAAVNVRMGGGLIFLILSALLFMAISVGRLRIGLPLLGIADGTPGQHVIIGAQGLAAAAAGLWGLGYPQALAWTTLGLSVGIFLVVKFQIWKAYTPRYLTRRSVAIRLFEGMTSGLVVLYFMLRDSGSLAFPSRRHYVSLLLAWVVGTTILGIAALLPQVRALMRVGFSGRSFEVWERAEAKRVERINQTGQYVAGTLPPSGGGFLLLPVLILPLGFLAGLPLPLIYTWTFFRRPAAG